MREYIAYYEETFNSGDTSERFVRFKAKGDSEARSIANGDVLRFLSKKYGGEINSVFGTELRLLIEGRLVDGKMDCLEEYVKDNAI